MEEKGEDWKERRGRRGNRKRDGHTGQKTRRPEYDRPFCVRGGWWLTSVVQGWTIVASDEQLDSKELGTLKTEQNEKTLISDSRESR